MSLFYHQRFVPLRVLARLTSPRLWPSAFCVMSVCVSVPFSLTYLTERSALGGLSMSQMAGFQGGIEEHLLLPFSLESSRSSRVGAAEDRASRFLMMALSQVRSRPHCTLKHRSGE